MYYINGEFLPETEAKISIFDLSVLRGFGAFDFLRTYRKAPFHLLDHLERLHFSCEHIGLTLPKSLSEIEEIIHQVLVKNNFEESSVKIIATGGRSPDQFTPHSESSLIVFATPLSPYPPHYYSKGIQMCSTRLSRSLPMSKTIQYTPAIVAMQRAKGLNPQEILYINEQNQMLEGATSNFFAFKKGVLHTCTSDEVLVGITREVVLRLAETRFPIETTPLTLAELSEVDEAFVTASTKEIMPVVQIDGEKIGDGNVGIKTIEIMRLFRDYTGLNEWPALQIPRHQLERSVR